MCTVSYHLLNAESESCSGAVIREFTQRMPGVGAMVWVCLSLLDSSPKESV
jgi:hypothetical protein